MKNAAQLWRDYHSASTMGNKELAKQILKTIQGYSGNPPQRGGCAKCRKSFY
jgi:hypothetical protein